MGLTAKQQLFVAHYLDCLNATEAARRAGYAQPMQQGSRLLRNVEVATAVRAGLAELAMPADEVLSRLSAIARADIRELMLFAEADPPEGEDGPPAGAFVGLRLSRDAPLHLIKSLTPTRYGYKIELHNQQAALDTLAKHHALLGGIDWAKIPQAILDLLSEGKITIDDIRRLSATGEG